MSLTPEEHANHPFRKSDVSIMLIAIAAFTSMIATTFVSIFLSLGAGLGSTPRHPVHHSADIAWFISGYAFIPILLVFVITLVTRKRIFGYLLGSLAIASGIALATGGFLTLQNGAAQLPFSEMPGRFESLIPVIAGVFILWQSRKLI